MVKTQTKNKERVIALDYFRGLAMLVVLLSHAYPFSRPYAYFSGVGNVWVSAAELFFLMSGVTLGVVRGGLVQSDFKAVLIKSWRRAFNLYLIYIFVTVLTVLLALIIKPTSIDLQTMIGAPASSSSWTLLGQIMSFSWAPGLANFLKFFAVYMVFAPFLLWAFYARRQLWLGVSAVSAGLFVASTAYPWHIIGQGGFTLFGIWQLYFVLGLALSRFRQPIISRIYNLSSRAHNIFRRAVLGVAGVTLFASVAIGFSAFLLGPVTSAVNHGFLPHKALIAYSFVLGHSGHLNLLLMQGRTGILRPLAVLLWLGAAYLIYQRHKQFLLARTGAFVNAIGRDTLWIFVAQAVVIPLLAIIPLKRNFVDNTVLTAFLVGSMWALTQRRRIMQAARSRMAKLSWRPVLDEQYVED